MLISLVVTGQCGQKVAGPEEATVRGNEVRAWWRKLGPARCYSASESLLSLQSSEQQKWMLDI